MGNTPLPEPDLTIMDERYWVWEKLRDHAAAVSAAKDERIKVLEEALWAADLAFAEHGILAVHATRMQVRAALGDKT